MKLSLAVLPARVGELQMGIISTDLFSITAQVREHIMKPLLLLLGYIKLWVVSFVPQICIFTR